MYTCSERDSESDGEIICFHLDHWHFNKIPPIQDSHGTLK